MKKSSRNSFLLSGKTAKKLYKTVRDLPIVDYHNHLSAEALQKDEPFENITKVWISPDPYKHRLMRIMGVEEKYITGDAADFEKFSKWCSVFPMLIGTPVYDWCKMEFETIFGITLPICEKNAAKLWEQSCKVLETLSPGKLMAEFNVEYASPCHSLIDNIDFYMEQTSLAPSLRCDDILSPSDKFISDLSNVSGIEINSLEDYFIAISHRLSDFEKCGMRFADISLDNGFTYYQNSAGSLNETENRDATKCEILRFLGSEFARRNIVMQLHIGAQRETSNILCSAVGKAGGFAAIGDDIKIESITSLLRDIENINGYLPKTILFTLNPAYNPSFAILSGSYSKNGSDSVVTQGPAWWWCDHKSGMGDFFDSFSSYSVLSCFTGMTTDSRSFLSFIRHDYFRRVLCSWIGEKVDKGEYPADYPLLKEILYKMCYGNARNLVDKNRNEALKNG